MAVFLILAALAMGVDIRRLIVLALVVVAPMLLVALMALLIWRSRPGDNDRPALFCEAASAELRAGASLRQAIAEAYRSVGGASEATDVPTADLAAMVADEFPSIGAELQLTIANSSKSGNDVATILDEIAALSVAQSEIRREVATATAPGRATALVLTGAPALYVMARAGSGGLGRLLLSPQQRLITLLGFGLFVLGLGIALAVVWRAGR